MIVFFVFEVANVCRYSRFFFVCVVCVSVKRKWKVVLCLNFLSLFLPVDEQESSMTVTREETKVPPTATVIERYPHPHLTSFACDIAQRSDGN